MIYFPSKLKRFAQIFYRFFEVLRPNLFVAFKVIVPFFVVAISFEKAYSGDINYSKNNLDVHSCKTVNPFYEFTYFNSERNELSSKHSNNKHLVMGTVHNVTQNLFYILLQDAINAANNNDLIELTADITEGLVIVNKSISVNGNGFILNSTSPTYGLQIAIPGISVSNIEIKNAGSFGIQTDCGADNLILTNVTVDNCTGTGISIYGINNAILTNITSKDNGGNGINFTNCNNTLLTGLTTSGNNFPGGFEAGIGIFTSNIYCLPGGINGLTINGPVSIAESTKAYSQKTLASHTIIGLSSNVNLFDWAVGIGALDRNYWTTKAIAYTVVDALFEAPFFYPNSLIYVVKIATEDYYVDDNPAGDPTPPMLIQTAINFLSPGRIINIEDGTYAERLVIDKSLTLDGTSETGTILDGSSLVGLGSGVIINPAITNVTIQDLTIKNFAGNSPNAYAGIYAMNGNNNLTVKNCTIKDNIGGCGFYANGPVNLVTLDNLDVSGHTAAFGAARGIVIWNGFKEKISITNCDVYNNNCCGIELQDGTASGVTMSNNNVHNNGDNGFGLSGLKGGAGPNLISNNIVANNGRFGIEIKNPNGNGLTSGDGSIYLDNNTVTFTPSVGMNIRDHAGIAIFRRAFQPGNPDGYPNIPSGVVVKNNTIDGYKHLNPVRIESEGFGIVVEGINNEVSANTIKNSDVGIQQQGGGHPNPNYSANNAGDGDQSDNKSASYFGRGNSPVACGNDISSNTFITNGLNQRTAAPGSGGSGFVTNTSTLEVFCSIQAAIDDPNTMNGHTLIVNPGTYVENLLINKELTLLGPNANIDPCNDLRAPEAVIVPAIADFNGISAYSIIDVQASNVTIKGFTIDGDNPAINTGYSSTNGADIDIAVGITRYVTGDNINISNNIVQNLSYFGLELYDYPAGIPSSSNIISNNKISDLGSYDNSPGGLPFWGGGVLLYNNQYASVSNNCMTNVRIGIQTGNFFQANPGGSTYQLLDGNTIQARRRGIFHNLHYATASPLTLINNSITGLSDANETNWDGILLSSLSVGSLSQDNIIDGTNLSQSEGYEVWNVKNNTPAVINGGSVRGVKYGLSVNNFAGYNSDATVGAHAIVSKLSVNNCQNGILIQDDPMSSHALVHALIQDDCEMINAGTGTGLLITGANSSVNLNENDASIHGFTIGVDVDGGTATITNNHIYENGTGIRVSNGGILNSTFGNLINSNSTDGIRIEGSAGSIGVINNNDLSGNSVYAINNLSNQLIDGTCNWFGTTNSLLVANQINGNIDFTPWLKLGIDFDPLSPGFQPVPNICDAIAPALTTTINTITINSNNDGIDDIGSFSVCNIPNNIVFNSFSDQNGLSNPLLKVFQTYTTSNVTVPFCNNCAAPMAAFTGVTGTAALINPALSGTLTLNFKSWVDVDNDQIIDPTEVASDWIVYSITINASPNCNISGTNSPVCPSSTNQFDAPTGMVSYLWTISGNGMINGADNSETVEVISGTGCNSNYTLNLEIVDDNGCVSTCEKLVIIQDITAPSLTGAAYPGISGINSCITNAVAAAPFNSTNAIQGYTDNCNGAVTATLTNTSVTGTDCNWTVTYTFTVIDACNNPLAGQTYSNTGSNQNLFTISCPTNLNLPCATDIPSGLPFTGTFSNNCGSIPTYKFVDNISNQTCRDRFTLTRTYTATNLCGNTTTCNQIITVNDIIHPSILCPNGVTVSCVSDIPAVDISKVISADHCGNSGIVVTHVSDQITNQICANKYQIHRTYRSTDTCGNSGTCEQLIIVNDVIPPVAICKNITVELGANGSYVMASKDIDNGSSDNCKNAGLIFIASDSVFNCAKIGVNQITLTVNDICGNSSTCASSVTVRENINPRLVCPTIPDIHLNPGECGRIVNFTEPFAIDNCTSNQVVIQTDTTKLNSGSYFPRGLTCLSYSATDLSGNVSVCTFCINIIEFDQPRNDIACNDHVQISLDDSCRATVGAELVLVGGPYSCYDDYKVEVRWWSGGGLIDRNPILPGTQIDSRDIGKELKITVIDPRTGNSCWGKAFVEDKLAPIMICARDTVLPCSSNTSPLTTGTPQVYESCSSFSLSYLDQITKGGCAIGYEVLIFRTWTAIDEAGNKSSCVQRILVNLGNIIDIVPPLDYDNIQAPMLNCNQKIDPNLLVGPHMLDYPECVDGYLLDSVFWNANSAQPNIYPDRRIPKILGWNSIDNPNDPNFGHPNPDPVYYPEHRAWLATNPLCWGPNTHIMWQGTGRPSGSNCANFAMTYSDLVFDLATPGCKAGPIGCYKILRKWIVLDWCTSTIANYNQIIKVIDQEGPQILYPDFIDLSTEVWSCYGKWEVPKPWILDNCSEEVHYSIEVEDGTVIGDEITGFIVLNLPVGTQNAYLVASDCCGNISKRSIILNVYDKVPPQAVCISKTVVSLSGNQDPVNNYTKVFAGDLDDGSFDNCSSHVWFKVIRMTDLLGTNDGSDAINLLSCNGLNGDDNPTIQGNQVYFDDDVKFCCADVGQRVMVVLRVFDVYPGVGPVAPQLMSNGQNNPLYGHFSDCMVEIEVQDKSVPTVVAPPNIVVSCWYWFDINNLTDPNDSTFGKVVSSLSNRSKVKTKDIVCQKFCEKNPYTGYPGFIQTNQYPIPAPNQACIYYQELFDTAHWDRKYDLVWGFDGYATSACGIKPTITVKDLRTCGQGQIQRIITAVGPNNILVSAVQTIWVVDCDPFYIDPLHCNDPRYSDIQWPNGVCELTPVSIEGCGADLDPNNPLLGKPIIVNNANDNCALIAIEKFDQTYTIGVDACYKILRTWVVIDWCQYDPKIDPNHGRWEGIQWIDVRDLEKPVVTCEVGSCEPAVIDSSLQVCVGHIKLTAAATDHCTESNSLYWEYKIDAYNDGKGIHGGYDYRVGSLTRNQYKSGDTVQYSHNPFADDRHNPFNASGTYPIGIHRIIWFVEDGCGNIGSCETLFEIKDCKAPTPYCLPGIITVPMPSTKCVDIWAKDLNFGSYDNCTPKDKLKFYFNGDQNKPSIRVCCDDFVKAGQNDELIIDIEMWVEDEEGNKDYCKSKIIVQDNLDSCLNKGSLAKIMGNLMTEGGEETKLANVQLEQNSIIMREVNASPYRFSDLPLNELFTIRPLRNDNHLNGISTADIVKIQKHILGQSYITSPYKLIAADVNASNSITSSDIVELRKLILGVIPTFNKVSSWTFVPTNYEFIEPSFPWNAPRVAHVSTSLAKEYNEQFVAIKMGDLTGNAQAGLKGTTTRTSGVINFEIEASNVQVGEIYRMDIRSSDFIDITGFQFTMNYDSKSLSFEDVEAGILNLNKSNIGNIEDGILTTSWNSNIGERHDANDVLYTLVFKVLQSGPISHMFAITSDVTKAEAYDNLEQVKEVRLGVRTQREIAETGLFELYQNEPNPFHKDCIIKYRLPETSVVKLTIYDVTGKVIRIYELQGQKGMNSIKLLQQDLNATGVLYYQLDASNHTATKRMVVIE